MEKQRLLPIKNQSSMPSSAYGLSNLVHQSSSSSDRITTNSSEPTPSPIQQGTTSPRDHRRPSLPSSASSSDIKHHGVSNSISETISPGSGKRAYRQRRKDPSCDACRERKVKCDATESASCSECSTRGVKCQFTKDPNRRLSSIRHLQDLERQLSQANQQIAELRALLDQNSTQAETTSHSAAAWTHINPVTTHTSRSPVNTATIEEEVLPSLLTLQHLFSIYSEVIQPQIPIADLDFSSQDLQFYQEYLSGREQDRTRFATLCAALACASLFDQEQYHARSMFFEGAIAHFNLAGPKRGSMHANVALLISIFLFESNDIERSRLWIVMASQILHDLQRASHEQDVSAVEQSWRAIWRWSRLLEEHTGPLLGCLYHTSIDSENSLQSQYHDLSRAQESAHSSPFNTIFATCQILSEAEVMLDRQRFSPSRLAEFDRRLDAQQELCMARFANDHYRPASLIPLCELLGLRFLFYRKAIPVATDHESRYHALDRCIRVAKSSSSCASQTLSALQYSQRSDAGLRDRVCQALRLHASTSFILHLWRCVLILCFQGEFTAVNALFEVIALIGDSRPANRECGLYLGFFLRNLCEKVDRGVDFSTDEETLHFALADIQHRWTSDWVETHASSENSNCVDGKRYNESTSAVDGIGEESSMESWSEVRTSLQHLQRFTKSKSSEPAVAMDIDRAPKPSIRPSNRISIQDIM